MLPLICNGIVAGRCITRGGDLGGGDYSIHEAKMFQGVRGGFANNRRPLFGHTRIPYVSKLPHQQVLPWNLEDTLRKKNSLGCAVHSQVHGT